MIECNFKNKYIQDTSGAAAVESSAFFEVHNKTVVLPYKMIIKQAALLQQVRSQNSFWVTYNM